MYRPPTGQLPTHLSARLTIGGGLFLCYSQGRRSGEGATLVFVDEGRKRVLGIMAAILAARKLAQFDGGRRVPATISAVADAVRWADEILREIDRRWPEKR